MWYISVILGIKILTWDNHEFEIILGFITRPCFKKINKIRTSKRRRKKGEREESRKRQKKEQRDGRNSKGGEDKKKACKETSIYQYMSILGLYCLSFSPGNMHIST